MNSVCQKYLFSVPHSSFLITATRTSILFIHPLPPSFLPPLPPFPFLQLYTDMRAYITEVEDDYARPIVTRTYNSSWSMYDDHLVRKGGREGGK